MIKATELRIGNWIFEKVIGNCFVVAITDKCVEVVCESGRRYVLDLENVEPIQIKCPRSLGFSKTLSAGNWMLMDEFIWVDESEGMWSLKVIHSVNDPSWTFVALVESVHRMQNLVFDMLKIELQFNQSINK